MKNLKTILLNTPKVFGLITRTLALTGADDMKMDGVEDIFRHDFPQIINAFKANKVCIGFIEQPAPALIAPQIPFVHAGWVATEDGLHFTTAFAELNSAKKAVAILAINQLNQITPEQKTPTKEAVKNHAEALFRLCNAAEGISTLDVKNAMRADSYWVNQSQVSNWMSDLSAEEDWDYENVGGHRMYFAPNLSTASSSPAVPTAHGSVKKPSIAHQVGDWTCHNADNVFDNEDYHDIEWIEAKKAFSNSRQIRYFDVRIRKLV